MSDHNVKEIRVGLATCGIASGGRPVHEAVHEAARRHGLHVPVKAVGCSGLCHQEPIVEVVSTDGRRQVFGGVRPAEARRIVRDCVTPRGMVGKAMAWAGRMADLLLSDEAWVSVKPFAAHPESATEAGQAGEQKLIVLENCGQIDPLCIDEYLARGGYAALRRCVADMTPQQVIDAVTQSGLRGRGGGGYPTGLKWATARSQQDSTRYVVCNADEGDPGAFMDRLVLESDPQRVIEGMAIAAYAIGAAEGYIYIRAEYPLAVRVLREAIAQAERAGYLGQGILGTGFSLRLHVMEGAGAFVCGEETALMASIMGRRGMPRFRPP